jgi:hypothetical protein
MRGDTPRALAYQDKLGRAYFDEGVAANGGDLAAGAAYYFGGPDPSQHGPKTAQYVRNVMARAGASSDDDMPSADAVMKAYGFGDTAPQASNPTPSTSQTATLDAASTPSPDDVAKAYGWQVPSPPPAPPPPASNPSLVGQVTGFMANVNRGLGIGDEMAAGFKTAGDVVSGKTGLSDIPSDFSANMAHQRQLEDGFAAEHPHIAALAKGTGNALTMAAPVGLGAEAFAAPVVVAGRQVPQVVANALRGATVGGLTGAGYAAVDRGSVGERLNNAAQAAQDPATLALGAGAGALATVGAPKPTPQAAPTLEDLQAAKSAAYKAVDDSKIQFTPQAFQQLTQNIADAMDKEGFNAGLHQKASAMLQSIGGSNRAVGGYSPTLTQLDQLRQQIGRDVASSPDAGERRMGQIMRGQIDQFIAGATPDQLTSAVDPQTAAGLLNIARNLNGRVAKLQSLDNLDEAAADRAAVSGSGSNGENTLRQNVLRFRNQNANSLTPDEDAAANKVIRGTFTGNALRAAGKTSPTNGGLMANLHMGAAAISHGLSTPAGIVAAVAKSLSEAQTTKNVQALRDLIATGGQTASEVTRQLADPQYADLRAQLANDLAAQAGVQGAARRGSVTVQIEGHPEYGTGVSSQ